MPFEIQQFFSEVIAEVRFVFAVLAPIRWIILPLLAFFSFLIFRDALLYSSQARYKKKIEWDFIEVKIPREIEKGPKAMEQFLSGLWNLRNAPTGKKEKYFDGEVTRWFSFEVFGTAGKVGFFIRTPKKLRHAVESMLYAEYPDIEISEAVDYTDELPKSLDGLYQIGYDLMGTEVRLGKEDPYPVNTYQSFEEKSGEERIIDPISVILELLSKLRPEEKVWIQILARPSDPQWGKSGEKIIEEMKAKIAPPKVEGQPFVFRPMAPQEEENLKLVGRKISKQGFDTLIRLLYLAPKDILNKDMLRQLTVYFGQYSSNLNFFFPNFKAMTRVVWWKWPYLFPKRRLEERKRRILYRFKERYLPEGSFLGRLSDPYKVNMNPKASVSILSSEELATLYHPPTNVVLTAPTLDRIESKKVSPPGYIPF